MSGTIRDVHDDVVRWFPTLSVSTVFDVGANVGQSVRGLRAMWPDARVLAFEPIPSTFAELEASIGEMTGVEAHQIALGAAAGTVTMRTGEDSTASRIVAPGKDGVSVRATTGDDFLDRYGIERVDYLKIDTEGHDLAVLRGFQGTLARFDVDLIQLEVGMNPTNQRHVPLAKVQGYLEPMGYLVMRIYEQVGERRGAPGVLRRCNVVFVSEPVAAAHPNRRYVAAA